MVDGLGPTAPSVLEVAVGPRRAVGRLIGACLLVEVLFVILDYFINLGRATDIVPLRHLFNIASEDGLGSWFSSAQTLLMGVTLWGIRACARNDPGSSIAARRGWLVLAVLFVYMAVDDGAQIHERLGTTFDELLHPSSAAGGPSWIAQLVSIFPSYMWQISILPALGLAAAVGFASIWGDLGAHRLRGLVLAGLGILVVAETLDFFEGLDTNHPWNLYTNISRHFDIEPWTMMRFHRTAYDTLEHVSKSIEEYLEMLGSSLLWLAFLKRLTSFSGTVRLRLG